MSNKEIEELNKKRAEIDKLIAEQINKVEKPKEEKVADFKPIEQKPEVQQQAPPPKNVKRCPFCSKSVEIPEGFLEGNCPYCNGSIIYNNGSLEAYIPKAPPVTPVQLSQNALNKAIGFTKQVFNEVNESIPMTQQAPPPQQKTPKNLIRKKDAAADVLNWLRPVKTLSFVAIFGSLICTVLGMLFLDIVALIVVCVVVAYAALILTKTIKYENYL